MMMNWDTADGYRALRCGNLNGGLVDQSEKWVTRIPVGLSFGIVLVIGDRIYAFGDNNTVHSLNSNNGSINWSTSLEQNGLFGFQSFCGSSDYLLIGSYVLKASTGELITELSEHTKHIAALQKTPTEIHDGKIYKPINTKHAPGKILVFDLDSKLSEIIDTGMLNLCMPEAGIAYGWKQEDDGYTLSSYNFNTSELSTVNSEVKLGRLSAEGKHLLVMNQAHITMLDLTDGSILWAMETASLMDTLDPKNVFSFKVCMSEDTLGFFQSGHYVQLNRFTGQKLWEKEFDETLEVCIAGDLIYAVHRISYTNQLMCALDKYNGQELWSKELGLPLNSVKAKDNKVLFVSVNGEIICHEWDEEKPYHSPCPIIT
jgi:outer membrane protein assembly factor BamB